MMDQVTTPGIPQITIDLTWATNDIPGRYIRMKKNVDGVAPTVFLDTKGLSRAELTLINRVMQVFEAYLSDVSKDRERELESQKADDWPRACHKCHMVVNKLGPNSYYIHNGKPACPKCGAAILGPTKPWSGPVGPGSVEFDPTQPLNQVAAGQRRKMEEATELRR